MDASAYKFKAPCKGCLDFDYIETVNFTSSPRTLSSIIECSITNSGAEAWTDVLFTLSGPKLKPCEVRIPTLEPGTLDLAGEVEILPDPAEVKALQEECDSSCTVAISMGGTEMFSQDFPLRLLPYDCYDLSDYDGATREVTKYTIWERKLLDFSLRNNLLNMRLGKKIIPLVSFSIEQLEDFLQDGQTFQVLPFPSDEAAKLSPDGFFDSKLYPQLEEKAVKGLASKKIYSYLNENDLKDALKYTFRSARTSLEENGVSNLYLVLGVLRWLETPTSTVQRLAPILLLPIDVKRRLGGMGYDIRTRDEDIVLNITLTEMLKQQHDIDLSALAVSLPEDDHGVDVKKIFAIIREKIRDKKGWNVLEESMIGLFSFSKFVMWNDIHSNSQLLHEHPVISSLVDGKLNVTDLEGYTCAGVAEQQIKPAELSVPLDVDSSQLEAVIDSGAGKSFILHGPPGTGKSQTITNIIANALYQGRRVLFVAEKMAALEVVQKRLNKIGLSPFCLELYSNKATKQHFLQQMDEALSVARIKSPEDYQKESDQLFALRSQLGSLVEALHAKGANGLSLHDCIMAYSTIPGEAMPVDSAEALGYTRHFIDQTAEKLCSLSATFRIVGQPNANPLRGLIIKDGSADAEGKIRKELAALQKSIQPLSANEIGLSRNPALLAKMQAAVAQGLQAQELHAAIGQRFGEKIFAKDISQMLAKWEGISQKWFLPRLVQQLVFIISNGMSPSGMRFLGEEYRAMEAANAVHAASQQQLARLVGNAPLQQQKGELEKCQAAAAVLERLEPVAAIEAPNADLPDSIARWLAPGTDMRNWYLWCRERQELPQCAVSYLMSTGCAPAVAADAFRKGAYLSIATAIINSNDALRHFNGLMFEDTIARYRAITKRFQELGKQELFARLASSIPSMAMEAHSSSEIGILKRNIKNHGRGMSIRRIIDQIPTLLPRLCPCMLMSPLSVAQYIDLNQPKFDLVLFDEASQMPTSEAVGAIARGNALIVVGDPKQMPPTSFFCTQAVDEDEAHIDDMESILDDCISLSIPSKYLTCHYRSRHESLIAFSNLQYYDGRLLTFPSVDDGARKVTLKMVEGVYDRSRTRSNSAEARAIVDEVLRRLADPELSKRSIGIVAFSKVQQDKIEDLLTDELAKQPALEALAYESAEPIFVKNLENVQGDERDVILFSVGYGPDASGKLSMNFGPLNNSGGERRLNVAISRARQEMMIFSSIAPEQIDLKCTSALGVAGLRGFLEFAKTGRAIVPASQAAPEADVLAQQIAEMLASHGYEAVVGVGRSRFRIDVAVKDKKDPEKYMLGILLDSAGYYSTPTMRDREVVQPSMLRGLGWNLAKVWTLDWFERREQVEEELLKQLGQVEAGKPMAEAVAEVAPVAQPVLAEAPKALGREYVFAQVAPGNEAQKQEPQVRKQLQKLIDVEQPITSGLLYKRIVKLWGFARVTPRIQQMVDDALSQLKVLRAPNGGNGYVYWSSAASKDAFEGYRTQSGRTIGEVPYVEIENAMRFVMEQQMSLQRDDLKRLTANCLGFTRLGTVVDEAMELVLTSLLAQGHLKEEDGRIQA